MSVNLEKIDQNVVQLEITVESDKLSVAVNQAAKVLAGKVNIPGFRKGKAPRKMVELHVGIQTLLNEAVEDLIGTSYPQAIIDSGISPVDRPDIEIVQLEEGKDLIYKAKVVVKPEVVLGEYKGLKVEKEATVVEDAQVDEDLKSKQQQHALLINIEEGLIIEGDTATIDFEGFVDGVAFDGGKGEDHDLVIGSGTFIPGFEDQLIGIEVGQEIDVNVQFPAEYHSKELAGKDAVFKVKVKKIQRKELAPIDDEFAKDISEFETLEELKTDIRSKLIKAAEESAESNYRNAVISKVVDNASVEIPPVMIDNRVDSMVKDFSRNLSYQGLSLEQYFSYTSSNEQAMKEQFRPQAAESVKTELVIDAITKAESITASDEELAAELEKMAQTYGQRVEVMKGSLEARGELDFIKNGLAYQKTVVFLIDQTA
ncbi:MAG: trigger factor [Desulfitobacteriaceae bacterium]|nr:trigger factor [Desulfitobacteriaceae bacterium]MDD4345719.1 trigger factor [Desulfitobacteriaceae bacterium]MDD4400423.1 trigger factor [Desulfitobacteriaceae bacterium]